MLLDRINAWLLCALLVLAPLEAQASQNALLSPTTGTVSGLQLTNNYNNGMDSLNTANSGATAPVNQLSGSASLGNWWLNTTSAPFPLGMNDGASNWPAIGSLDPTAHAWNLQIGGGAAILASSSTVDLCSTPRNYLTISGTTTITSFGSTCPAGVVKLVTFSGALTLTYNATSLIIPGAASISPTVPGDQATLVSLGGGNFQVATYTPASGGALINPAVDIGTYQLTSAVNLPSSKYLLAYGQAVLRTTYAAYLAASTITQSVTRTNGSPTLTGFTDTTQIRLGAPLEGNGLPTGATVGSITSTTLTMASTCSGGAGACNAISSGTGNVTIYPNGNGDGSTTFNMPNCQDVVLAGRGNMSGTPRNLLTSTYFGAVPDALGVLGGSQNVTLSLAQLPTGITSTGSTNFTVVGGQSFPAVAGGNSISSVQVAGTGSGTTWVPTVSSNLWGTQNTTTGSTPVTSNNTSGAAHPTVQPTLTANCMVRVLAMLDRAPDRWRSITANDNALPIADRPSSLALRQAS